MDTRKPRIMFEHDARHSLIYMYEPPINREELESAVDELVGTPVDALMFMVGDTRSLLYNTTAGERWGHYVKKWPHLIWRRAKQNFDKLIEEGNDPLRVICDRAHANGMLLYAQLLVQAGPREHSLKHWEREDFDEQDWHLGVQPLEIGAKGDLDPSFPGYRCLDFKHQEVRESTLGVIEEMLANYPVDGLELELTYQPYYFHPSELEEGRGTMTEWIGRVHAAVKASGPERELAVHVPASLEDCASVGLELLEWVRRGIVDVVIAEPIGPIDEADPMSDFRPLVAAAKGSACRIHAALKSHIDVDRAATIEGVRAVACNYWAQGIDGLDIVRWLGWPYRADFYEKLRELPYPEVMGPKDKHYRVPTEATRPVRPVLPLGVRRQLPADLRVDEPVRIELSISDDLPRWDRADRVHEVLLRVRISESTELDEFSFRMNGKELPDRLLRKISEIYTLAGPSYRSTRAYWYVFKLDREHWPVRGTNTLEVTLRRRDPEVTPQISLHDMELETRYLMGKNHYRGYVDPDMGPYQHLHS